MFNRVFDKQVAVKKDLCTGCGSCVHQCWSGVLRQDDEGIPYMIDITEKRGWDTCFECQRCMAACPTGAFSICGRDPANSRLISDCPSGEQMEALIACRRTCRHYKDQQVDKDLIEKILRSVGNSPTGSCQQLVEFTLIDDISQMRRFKELFYAELQEQFSKGIYPEQFPEPHFSKLMNKKWQDGIDIAFQDAPHLVIVHAPVGRGEWITDVGIALAYLELLLFTHGLGAIYLGFAKDALGILPQLMSRLNIPQNHYYSCLLGFGYPDVSYYRGVQREHYLKINRVTGL